tara:strand:- start:104 stop:358 length:255 start_codon:yes stop_codon:yes gene_type:complete
VVTFRFSDDVRFWLVFCGCCWTWACVLLSVRKKSTSALVLFWAAAFAEGALWFSMLRSDEVEGGRHRLLLFVGVLFVAALCAST